MLRIKIIELLCKKQNSMPFNEVFDESFFIGLLYSSKRLTKIVIDQYLKSNYVRSIIVSNLT